MGTILVKNMHIIGAWLSNPPISTTFLHQAHPCTPAVGVARSTGNKVLASGYFSAKMSVRSPRKNIHFHYLEKKFWIKEFEKQIVADRHKPVNEL